MSVRVITGDCRDVLKTLPDESVHCVVTSPPYFGLRDYGNAGQIGLEPTPDAFVAELVAVFREVRRVLRADGTCWLNLGDSYAGSWGNYGGQNRGAGKQRQITNGSAAPNPAYDGLESWRPPTSNKIDGIKPKDLIGIPWRVAFALQADGWYLRQDLIWSKPNPMPESVTDRCTKAHEYLFLLSKAPRYFYDADAIRQDPTGRTDPIRSFSRGSIGGTHTPNYQLDASVGANKRSVWEVSTQPYSDCHFATFPPALIEPCIKAGTSESGCCAKCGAPWVRQTEYGRVLSTGGSDTGARAQNLSTVSPRGETKVSSSYVTGNMVQREKLTTGWLPSCACAAPAIPCTVLDPFAGAGTTGLVADRLQRSAVLIELNPEYAAMARDRIHGDAPLFAQMAAE